MLMIGMSSALFAQDKVYRVEIAGGMFNLYDIERSNTVPIYRKQKEYVISKPMCITCEEIQIYESYDNKIERVGPVKGIHYDDLRYDLTSTFSTLLLADQWFEDNTGFKTASGGSGAAELEDVNNLNNTLTYRATASGTNNLIISDVVYPYDIAVTSINVLPGTSVSGVTGYIYIYNTDDRIESVAHSFSGDFTANVSKSIPVNFTVPEGFRIGIQSAALKLKYGATDDTGFIYTAGNIPLTVNTIIPANAQVFNQSVSLGWTATRFVDVIGKTSKLDGDGNALSGFEVPIAVNPNEPVRLSQVESSVLSGKKLYVTGDSMAKGHSTAASNVSYSLVADRNSMTYVNEGVNGNYLTSNGLGSGTPLIDRIQTELDTDSDYVLINVLTNDIAGNITLGSENSTDNTEIYGALNNILQILQTTVPNAKIGFITPYNRNTYSLDVVQAIEVACGKIGIPVFNSIEDGNLNWNNTAQVNARTLGDSYHCNDAGHLYNSYLFEAFLKSL